MLHHRPSTGTYRELFFPSPGRPRCVVAEWGDGVTCALKELHRLETKGKSKCETEKGPWSLAISKKKTKPFGSKSSVYLIQMVNIYLNHKFNKNVCSSSLKNNLWTGIFDQENGIHVSDQTWKVQLSVWDCNSAGTLMGGSHRLAPRWHGTGHCLWAGWDALQIQHV